jgi:riboflavin kinase / FMN adenylyltransferase
VAVGQNFTFGHRGAGDLNTLREVGSRYRLAAEGVGLVREENERHSSTRIRACLRRGEVGAAARMLGRPHRVEGFLRADELTSPPYTALPAPGRYLVGLAGAGPIQAQVLTDGRIRLPAATAVDGPASVDFIAVAP